MSHVRCVSNCMIVETGREAQLFASRWVPLTIGETYAQICGPERPHYRFVLNDDQEVRAYPDYLFEEMT